MELELSGTKIQAEKLIEINPTTTTNYYYCCC